MFRANLQIGPYALVRRLGKGGFGEVWLAERSSQFFTKRVAVKLPHDEQIDFETIRREATLWEEASGHPNVLPIIDADIYDGQVVIVSEYADGGSLADKLKNAGAFSPKQAVEMIVGILNGLEFLHNKKIIHRDIKPQNVLLQGDTPRLADFGISRAMHTSTISSVVIGTDAYMSPEAFDGKRNVRTDIWSVGVVLYQLLKGSLPFPQEHPSERMYAVLTKPFEPLPDSVPAQIKEVLQRALAKLPENRYEAAAEMREALRNSLSQPIPNQQSTAAVTLPVTQPYVEPNRPAPTHTGNQSIVTKFAAVPPLTEMPVVNPTATQTFNTNQRADLKKAAVTSAVGVALAILLLFGAIAGFFSLSRDYSNTPSDKNSNSASIFNSGATSNQDVTAQSSNSADAQRVGETANNAAAAAYNAAAAANNAIATPNSNQNGSSNTLSSDTRSGTNYNSGKTSNPNAPDSAKTNIPTSSESTRTSNPTSSDTTRTSDPDYTKPRKVRTVDADEAGVFEGDPDDRTLRPMNTTRETTTRKPNGEKTTTRIVTRDGSEMPPEVRREIEKMMRENPRPNANMRRP